MLFLLVSNEFIIIWVNKRKEKFKFLTYLQPSTITIIIGFLNFLFFKLNQKNMNLKFNTKKIRYFSWTIYKLY